jgi:hypothetical protein
VSSNVLSIFRQGLAQKGACKKFTLSIKQNGPIMIKLDIFAKHT